MATSLGSNPTFSLKRYIITSATSMEKLNSPLSITIYQSGNMPAQHIQRFSDDPLFSGITATAVTPKFVKRRGITRIDVYSSKSVHPGDKCPDCFTGSQLDQYLARGLPISCQTSRGRFVSKQLSPVCDIDLKDIKPIRRDHLCAGNYTSVGVENRNNYFNNYASNSSDHENGDRYTMCTSKNEKRESTPVLPSLGKRMITKSAERRSQGKKRKNDDDKSDRSEIGPDSCDMVEWSRTTAVLSEKTQHRIQNKSSQDGSHHSTDRNWSSDCSSNDRCSIKGHDTYTSITTSSVKNVSVCERFQKERSSFYDTRWTLNSNSLKFSESRKSARKRPVMGKGAKFASIDSLSLGVLAEFKRNVHMKYGDRKRRRMKTNGILKLATCTTSKITIINDILKSADVSRQKLTNGIVKSPAASKPTTRAISRSVGPCRKLISMKKNIILMKRNCSRISYL